MKGIMNKNQLWYGDICDKKTIIKNKSKHINSKTHKHEQKYGSVVKEYEILKPDIDEVNYILNDTTKDCTNKYFHSFQYRCVYDIKFTNMEITKKLF